MNFIKAEGLSEKQVNDIARLEEICGSYEELHMKMNWDMLKSRPPQQNNDFLCYDGEQLVGFLGLYDIEGQRREIELTGLVHPQYRRRGIFKALFESARQKCTAMKAERMLLVSERSKLPAAGFAASVGAVYFSSEYKMLFDDVSVPSFPGAGIKLRAARPQDVRELGKLDKVCFGYGGDGGDDPDAGVETNIDAETNIGAYDTTLVAELEQNLIGKIGLMKENGEGYIFGFGVVPELRGRGYGREILSLALSGLLSEGIKEVLLEVAVKNERALLLYKACGFREISVYDYHLLEVSK